MVIVSFNSREAWLEAGLEAVRSALGGAAAAGRDVCHIALAGGNTPESLYAALARDEESAALAERIAVHFWLGDERDVPPESAHRNESMIRRTLAPALGGESSRAERRGDAPGWARPAILHPWPALPGPESALRYAEELTASLGEEPIFDLVLLGLGADGHTASLFPGDAALEARGVTAPALAPVEPRRRMTLTYRVLDAARVVRILVRGADKAAVIERAFGARGAGAGAGAAAFPVACLAGADVALYVLTES